MEQIGLTMSMDAKLMTQMPIAVWNIAMKMLLQRNLILFQQKLNPGLHAQVLEWGLKEEKMEQNMDIMEF